LEHVPDVDAVIAEMARTCRSGAVGSQAIGFTLSNLIAVITK
jgi:2-polyprenyl-3-methyl-5-hydroxy-6-metoxy-1,4-benzoquinol methylase